MTTNARGPGWQFDNSYTRLPDYFFQRTQPVPVAAPARVLVNHPLARAMGLEAGELESGEGTLVFAGNAVPEGADPIAQAYAGHQFGGFTMLGDGRAVLLGEHLTPDGLRLDVQLKGSGRTAFSRRGDGRAALGPMLREYIISEAMHGLGVPTTRSLAVVSTGEQVHREEPLPGAVLTRIAASHIRVGTFEYAAGIGEAGAVSALLEYTVRRHFPELAGSPDPALALLLEVVERQSALLARWLQVGFVHGVMNTDNMAISGETIDYGPCAFLDAYDPATVFSSIDHHGRYAYGNQPSIAHWNLARLAESLLSEIDPDPDRAVDRAKETLAVFPERFRFHWLAGMRAKIGLTNEEPDDADLIEDFLKILHSQHLDYTNTFRALDPGGCECPALAEWHRRWTSRLARQPGDSKGIRERLDRANPAVIPRNHLVERALEDAVDHGDLTGVTALVAAVSNPYFVSDRSFCEPAPPGSEPYRTFCGT